MINSRFAMQPVPVAVAVDGFNHHDPKYITGKGCCHSHCVKAATRIAYLYVAVFCLSLLSFLFRFEPEELTVLQVVWTAVQVLVVGLFFIGVKKTRPVLVQPFVLIHLLAFAAYIVGMVACVVTVIWPHSHVGEMTRDYLDHKSTPIDTNSRLRWACLGSFLALAICAMFTYWFYTIAKQCHSYLADYVAFCQRNGVPVNARGLPPKV